MKESYIEGLATHDDPESCTVPREGGWRSIDRGTHRQGIEPRNHPVQDADGVSLTGKLHVSARQASTETVLRGLRPLACAETPRARTGRSTDRPRVAPRAAEGRPEAVAR